MSIAASMILAGAPKARQYWLAKRQLGAVVWASVASRDYLANLLLWFLLQSF